MFRSDLSAGSNAENIFWHFAGQLSDINILSPIRVKQEYIEGKDILSAGMTKKGCRWVSTEVKAVLKNTFITRDNDNLVPSGTLPFELWSNAWDENGSRKPPRNWTVGWLPAMMNPKVYNEFIASEENNITVEAPDQIAFMLCDDSQGKKPYACILFPSFRKLKNRLKKIATNQDAPFNLERLPSPMDRLFWKDKRRNVPYNVWQVPLDELIDLAKVTIFSDVPIQIDQQKKTCPIRIQNARRDYLIAHASTSINRVEEYQKAQAAGRAYKRFLGFPEEASVPHMTFFDLKKLPSNIKRKTCPEWMKECNSWAELKRQLILNWNEIP